MMEEVGAWFIYMTWVFNLGGIMLLYVFSHSELKMVDQERRCVIPCMCVYIICDV